MTTNGRMRIEEIQDGRDGLARTINIVLDGKTIRTPDYCVPLGKSYQFDDLELRLRIQGQTRGHIGSYVIRGFDYEQVLRDRVRSIDQGTIGGDSYQSPIFRDFFSKDIFFYDPSGESLEYNRYLRKLTGSKRTPAQARELGFELAKLRADGKARNIRLEKVWNFWASMMDDRRGRAASLWERLRVGRDDTTPIREVGGPVQENRTDGVRPRLLSSEHTHPRQKTPLDGGMEHPQETP